MLPGDSKNLRNKAARYLTHRFQDGMFDEGRLRMALKQFLKSKNPWTLQSIDGMMKAAHRKLIRLLRLLT